jgi:molybdate transport system substrate-binding protein
VYVQTAMHRAWLSLLALVPTLLFGAEPEIVSLSEVAPRSFSPARGESTRVTLSVAQAARVTLCWTDESGAQVACPLADAPLEPGGHTIAWDGKDRERRPVRDEAYSPRIEAVSKADGARQLLDPARMVPSEPSEVPVSDFEVAGDALSYTLDKPGRVLVRLGIRGGPLLRTLVDWSLRPAGVNREPWDGYDEGKLQEFCRHPRYAARVSWLPLPDFSVITHGAGVSRKPRAVTSVPLVLSLLDAVRVDVPEAYRSRATGLTEVMLYVDNELVAEAKEPHLPYEFPRPAREWSAGTHIVTVNVLGVPNQAWTGSLAFHQDPPPPLRVAAAGALRPAMRELAASYAGRPVEIAFSSSQAALDAVRKGQADVVVVGHEAFMDQAKAEEIIDPDRTSTQRVAYLVPVIVVPKGNPKAIVALPDLLRPGVRLALADPGSTCLGATTRELFARDRAFEAIAERVVFHSSSCEETVGVVADGRADAAIGWHVLSESFAGRVETVRLVGNDVPIASAWAAVAKTAQDPVAARSFVEYLTAPASAKTWHAQGYPTREDQARSMTGELPLRRDW